MLQTVTPSTMQQV